MVCCHNPTLGIKRGAEREPGPRLFTLAITAEAYALEYREELFCVDVAKFNDLAIYRSTGRELFTGTDDTRELFVKRIPRLDQSVTPVGSVPEKQRYPCFRHIGRTRKNSAGPSLS
jgi:hypothetical protein